MATKVKKELTPQQQAEKKWYVVRAISGQEKK